PKALTITANSQGKTYGDADPDLTYAHSDLVNNDTTSVFSGTLARAAGNNVGTYAINKGTLSAGNNYEISYAGANLTIDPKALTITVNSQGKTYGDAEPDLTYAHSALVNGDSISGTLARAAGNNVGTYAINQGTLSAGNNYEISYTGANLTIDPKALTITANPKSKTYGDVDPGFTYTIIGDGLYGTDLLTGVLSRNPGEKVNGGPYLITQGTINNPNYNITFISGSTLDINVKSLTAALTGTVSKAYDGNTTATLVAGNYNLSGVVAADNVLLNNPTSGTYDTKAVGTDKTISISGLVLSGTDAGNYRLDSTTISANLGSITPRNLIIELNTNISKIYDGTTAATYNLNMLSLSNKVGNDDVSLNVTNNAIAKFIDPNPGNNKKIIIEGISLIGAQSNYYQLNNDSFFNIKGSILSDLSVINANANVTNVTYLNSLPASERQVLIQQAITNLMFAASPVTNVSDYMIVTSNLMPTNTFIATNNNPVYSIETNLQPYSSYSFISNSSSSSTLSLSSSSSYNFNSKFISTKTFKISNDVQLN
ncbi:MAG: MBG domain-containing protein, partial [Gammaproteobacteria bacterium]